MTDVYTDEYDYYTDPQSVDEKWPSESKLSRIKSFWNSWAPERDTVIQYMLPSLLKNKLMFTNILFDYLDTFMKENSGNLMSMYFKLTRYLDVFFNVDAACHFLGDLLLEVSYLFSCNPRRTISSGLIIDKLVDVMNDSLQKDFLLKLIHDFLHGEIPLRKNTRTYTGMKWTIYSKNEFDTLKFSSGKKWIFVGTNVPIKGKEIINVRLVEELSHVAKDPDPTTKYSMSSDVMQTFTETLRDHHYVKCGPNYFSPMSDYTELVNLEFYRHISEFYKNPDAIFKEIHGPSPPENIPKYETFCMKDMEEFQTFFPEGVEQSSFIVVNLGDKTVVCVEETVTGVSSILSRAIKEKLGTDKIPEVIIERVVETTTKLHRTTNFLDNLYEEMKHRIACKTETRRENYVLSGNTGNMLKYVGLTQSINKIGLFTTKVKSVLNTVVSDVVIGDILFELSFRLKRPTLTQSLISKINPRVFLQNLLDTNYKVKQFKKYTSKLSFKDCEKTCKAPIPVEAETPVANQNKDPIPEKKKKSFFSFRKNQ